MAVFGWFIVAEGPRTVNGVNTAGMGGGGGGGK